MQNSDIYIYVGFKANWQTIRIGRDAFKRVNATIHYNSAEPQTRSADSDFTEPETTTPATEPASQVTEPSTEETGNAMPEKSQPEENDTTPDNSNLPEESPSEEVSSEEALTA